MWFHIGGECGCFVLINNDVLEHNPPYMQSNFTFNPSPTENI